MTTIRTSQQAASSLTVNTYHFSLRAYTYTSLVTD